MKSHKRKDGDDPLETAENQKGIALNKRFSE